MNGHTVKGAKVGSWMMKIVIANNEKNQRHAPRLYVRARFCSYAFLSKCIRVNMKKIPAQPVVEKKLTRPKAPSSKLQA